VAQHKQAKRTGHQLPPGLGPAGIVNFENNNLSFYDEAIISQKLIHLMLICMKKLGPV
jgi:hypothetical protein